MLPGSSPASHSHLAMAYNISFSASLFIVALIPRPSNGGEGKRLRPELMVTCFWSPTRILFRRPPVLAIINFGTACSVQLMTASCLTAIYLGNVEIVRDMLR